jgi:hypothetical protein
MRAHLDRPSRINSAGVFKLTEMSQHKFMDTLRGYVCRSEMFKNHVGPGFL